MPGIEDQRQKQIDLQEAICPPMTLSGFPSGSLDILIEALNEAKNKGDGRHLSILYSRLANYFVAMGNKIQALEYSTKGLNEAEKIGDVDLIISAAYFNLLSYSNYGNVKKVIELAPRLIELIENNQREAEFFGKPFNIYAELLSLYGYYLGFSGKFEEGEAKADLGLTYAWKINHLPTVVVVEVFFGSIY